MGTHHMNLQAIVAAVKAAGGRTYCVGGSVRDAYLGILSKDMDLLVTGLPVERLTAALSSQIHGVKIDLVGASFGVLKVTLGSETIDVALPRTEKSTGIGHRDFAVQSDHTLPLETDLSRRDFTMNAIAQDAETGEYIDPFGGIQHIQQRVIQAVGNAQERFAEDPLRMLRAVRFASKLRMRLGENVIEGLEKCSALLGSVAKERVGEEMSRLLMGPSGATVVGAIRHMIHTGLMAEVIPEFMASVGFEQRNQHHFLTVENHVLMALEHAVNGRATLRARWAVLLHDIAKPATFTIDEAGNGHFYEHEDKGAVMAQEILLRLKFPTDFIEGVSRIVAEHLRPQTDSNDRALRRYVARMGELTEDGITCREADLYAHKGYQETAQPIFEGFRERIAGLKEITGFSEAKLALRGDEIAKEFQVSGRGIGEIKKKAALAVIDGLVINDRAALLVWLRAN